MKSKKLFRNLYSNTSIQQWVLITLLLFFVIGVLLYFNNVRKSLEEREEKYAKLYAEAIRFFTERSQDNCDYGFVQEVLSANETVPSILVTDGTPSFHLNIPELDDSTKVWTKKTREDFLYQKIAEMASEHEPIQFKVGKSNGYVYYSNSNIVRTLRYFPLILVLTFLIFGSLAFVAYASSRRAEQNRVWVGLAKETAHQLGTPISGLIGWIEVLKLNPDFDASLGDEMLKDIKRLEVITNRFSNIGSVPTMKPENLVDLVFTTTEYLKKRISTKINWSFENTLTIDPHKKINNNLIEWVIENLCKNAVDAMEGVGSLHIKISDYQTNKIAIDITDSGKGMNSRLKRKIFNPGFTTKNRGWGLGLTLAKRIIETYHSGQIGVLESTVGKGTTFRIIL
jgi:Histidine kinase-, DNA gyrase B-, and HSP90-like ATPase